MVTKKGAEGFFALSDIELKDCMNEDKHKNLHETLRKDNTCYVLITCSKPSKDGNMDVEMTYEGETSLAAYLVEGAQSVLDQQLQVKNTATEGKIQRLL